MQKLKKKNIFNLLDYQHFLKKNNLKKDKLKLRENLFENHFFLKNRNLIWIELDQHQSFFLPNFDLKKNQKSIIYTIQTKYENHFLFNYFLNYKTLYYFTKLIFKNKLNKDKIKGRIINYNKNSVKVSFLGVILKMKLKNLYSDSKLFYNRKKKLKKIFSYYRLKYLNLKINQDFFKKSKISRKTYVQEIIEKQNFKKKKK